MSVTDLHARNDRILRLRARGLTQPQIASAVGLTDRQVRRILREREQARFNVGPSSDTIRAPDAADVPATALVDQLEDVVAALARKVAAYAGPRDRAATVAVARLRLDADAAIAELRARATEFPQREPDMSGHQMSGTHSSTSPGEGED